MTETNKKKSDTKIGTTPKKPAKDKTEQSTEIKNEKDGFLSDAANSVESNVDAASEKISEIAEKTVETAGELFKAVKKGLSSTYDASAKLLDEISSTAEDYIDKYKKNMEVNKLSEKRDELTKKLGIDFYTAYKTKKIDNLQSFFQKQEIIDLIDEIAKIEKDIVKIGKKLEKNID